MLTGDPGRSRPGKELPMPTRMTEAAVRELSARVDELTRSLPPERCWQKISREILKPDYPFELHRLFYEKVYAGRDPALGPPPAWIPSEEFIRSTNIAALMSEMGLDTYSDLHRWSVDHREAFWEKLTRQLRIRFKSPYRRVMDLSGGLESPGWYPGAKLNITDSCFNTAGDATAIVYQGKGEELSSTTYAELASLSARIANGLVRAGFNPGDAIAVAVPMTPESVAAYIAIVMAGCTAVSIAESFAAPEIAKRLRLGGARAVFTQDFVPYSGKRLPLYEKVISADAPRAIVLSCDETSSVKLRDGDVRWEEFLDDRDRFDSIPRSPGDHTNILFSSGTTGDPKAIPWTHTTPVRCAADACLHHDVHPGDVLAWPSSLGWMMGPWLICASLVNGAAMALYGDAPGGREFGKFVQDARVTMLGVVPALVRAWKNTGCMQGLDWSRIKAFSSTGECSNAPDMLFLMSLAGYKPVIEYCGGTEIGGGYITGTVVQPAAPATFTTPGLGLDLCILDEGGQAADNGEVFIIPPSIGLSTELLNLDHHEVYFEGTPRGPSGELLRRHGDQIERLGGGYFRAHGRVDDTMNIGGIKVSSAEIEQVLNTLDGIRETAAIAASSEGEGPSELIVCAVPVPGARDRPEELKGRMQALIRQQLNPLFKIRRLELVDSLPRTASNKVMRRTLRARYDASTESGRPA